MQQGQARTVVFFLSRACMARAQYGDYKSGNQKVCFEAMTRHAVVSRGHGTAGKCRDEPKNNTGVSTSFIWALGPLAQVVFLLWTGGEGATSLPSSNAQAVSLENPYWSPAGRGKKRRYKAK